MTILFFSQAKPQYKVDMVKERKVTYRRTTFHRKKRIPYFPISGLANFNLHQPLLYICRVLLEDPELYFTEPLVLPPPQTAVDPEQVEHPIPPKGYLLQELNE